MKFREGVVKLALVSLDDGAFAADAAVNMLIGPLKEPDFIIGHARSIALAAVS